MFNHGWNNYMQHAYPEDELNPLLCTGRGSDKANPSNIQINDVLGDFSLTLVDTLDTLAILGTQEQFEEAVRRVIDTVSFEQYNKVQVFEANIRALGGLLSAHILATDPTFKKNNIPWYTDDSLLHLAVDLADRLLPAFNNTPTGIPFPRVNLGLAQVPPTETVETCTAGAGSLILEFGVLSRLTGDPKYERAAKIALHALWERRSSLNLLGNVINIQTGHWIHTASSTGAGIDSVFEYMLKAAILFDDQVYHDMFNEAYRALLLFVRDSSGYLYRNVHMGTGSLMSYWIDSLSAFFPGLQVLHGDLDTAIKNHLVYYHIWRKYHALPERFNFHDKTVDLAFYPLRPEFVESTYHLYTATKDPFYLEVGEMVLEDINNRTRVPCGFASIGDVRTGRLEDRMESFMLSETLKYLYLLFDTEHEVNRMDANIVFTTEGHILALPMKYQQNSKNVLHLERDYKQEHQNSQQRKRKFVALGPLNTCQRYNPHKTHYTVSPNILDMSSIPYQPHIDFAAEIVGMPVMDQVLSKYGICQSPIGGSYEVKFSSSPDSEAQTIREAVINYGFEQMVHQQHRSQNVLSMLNTYLIKSLSGLKMDFVARDKTEYIVKRG
ncbi:glycosyl hydrolase family 47-domain-containing protein [Mycotypha africana]|uniref:glycosyl hydrolase family 47-domain-containing protein n=1 Tax=Mycotypha africana TaxID=64632 RepID=UPI002300D40F|nr:glycosyl hydrolase family 47-domain-containing protein [Mycotypha africana]KAI8967221.1 glycosyl hydrolase family 47-domain-containing protein [Mycotypha africana]